MRIEFKATDCVEVKNDSLIDRNVKFYESHIKYKELKSKLNNYVKVNPRTPCLNEYAVKAISGMNNTIKYEPDKFVLHNLGLIVTAKSVSGDVRKYGEDFGWKKFKQCSKEGHRIFVDLDDVELHGLMNGAHTYFNAEKVMMEKEYGSNVDNIEIPVRFIVTGNLTKDEIDVTSTSVNTMTQLAEVSEFNKQGKFDSIKTNLENKPYFKFIAFKENDISADITDDEVELVLQKGKRNKKKEFTEYDFNILKGNIRPISVVDVAKLAYMFDVSVFDKDGNRNPLRANVREHDILTLYLSNEENLQTFKSICKNMLPTIIDLYCDVYITMPESYGSRFKSLGMIKSQKTPIFYKNTVVDYKIPEGVLNVLLASLRVCADKKSNGEIYFKYDPIIFYDLVKEELVKDLFNTLRDGKENPSNVVQKQLIWKSTILKSNLKLKECIEQKLIKELTDKDSLSTFDG